MKRLAVLILFVLSLVPASPAFADQSIPIQGTDTFLVNSGTCSPIGSSGYSKDTLSSVDVFTGDLSGSAPGTFSITALRPCGSAPGNVEEIAHGVAHFTGTVFGRAGSFDMVWNWRINGNFYTFNEVAIQNGTGELAGIHGVIREEGSTLAPLLNYTGHIQFAP